MDTVIKAEGERSSFVASLRSSLHPHGSGWLGNVVRAWQAAGTQAAKQAREDAHQRQLKDAEAAYIKRMKER